MTKCIDSFGAFELGDENGVQNLDVGSLTKLIGAAKGAALVNVIKRVKGGNKLAAHELDLLNEIENKINSQQNEAPVKKRTVGAEREFESLVEVVDYLDEEGWKISKSTIYEHQKKGMIRPDNGKKYTLKAVVAYAKAYLVLKKTRQKKKDEDLQRQKTLAEIERIQEKTKLEKIIRLNKEGKLIEKESVYLELASRAAVLEAGLKGMVQARARDWVTLVDGDEKKTADLVRELMTEIDLTVNEFATTKEFQVVFE